MNNKIASDGLSDRNKEHVIENWRKGDLHYKVAKLHSAVLWIFSQGDL